MTEATGNGGSNGGFDFPVLEFFVNDLAQTGRTTFDRDRERMTAPCRQQACERFGNGAGTHRGQTKLHISKTLLPQILNHLIKARVLRNRRTQQAQALGILQAPLNGRNQTRFNIRNSKR